LFDEEGLLPRSVTTPLVSRGRLFCPDSLLFALFEELLEKANPLLSESRSINAERSEKTMVDDLNENVEERKKKLGYEWIRSESTGISYLCPVGSIKDKKKATDKELKEVCVDESANPQND